MRRLPLLAALLALAVSGCSHVVLIKTTPPGARVYIDDEIQGVTPLFFEEATGFGRSYRLRLELDGYQSEALVLEQDQWWHSCLWPSLCLIPVTLGVSATGLLFARSLRDEYHYLLRPAPTPTPAPAPAPADSTPASQPEASAPPTS